MKPNDGHPEHYRYEVTVKVLIAANGLHEAWPRSNEIAQAIKDLPHVVNARAPMSELRHRPDIDGSLRVEADAR